MEYSLENRIVGRKVNATMSKNEMDNPTVPAANRLVKIGRWGFFRQRYLILMVIPGVLIVLIFNYFPIYGALIAFKDYDPTKGVVGSSWVGLKYFVQFFHNPLAWSLIRNTVWLGVCSLLWEFPTPIILALLLDQVRSLHFKKTVQTVSYFPHFLSTVVVVGMIKEFFAIGGIANDFTKLLGMKPIPFLVSPSWFVPLYVGSGVWQGIGWGTIIYLAALTRVDPQLVEAAMVDGASRWQRVLHVSWPAILPTTSILLIFSVSSILSADFQKVLLLYSPPTYSTADIIATYVYREGIAGGRFEYATAVGLLMSVVACLLLVLANTVSRRLSENSLW